MPDEFERSDEYQYSPEGDLKRLLDESARNEWAIPMGLLVLFSALFAAQKLGWMEGAHTVAILGAGAIFAILTQVLSIKTLIVRMEWIRVRQERKHHEAQMNLARSLAECGETRKGREETPPIGNDGKAD